MSNVAQLLQESRIIAIVGLSDKPERASNEVAAYLLACGYRILPVNPALAGREVLGQRAYASLQEAADAVAPERIDIVDCFRRSEEIVSIAHDAIAVQARCLWMQLEVVNEEAAQLARAAGLDVVMNHCLKIEHRKLEAAA